MNTRRGSKGIEVWLAAGLALALCGCGGADEGAPADGPAAGRDDAAEGGADTAADAPPGPDGAVPPRAEVAPEAPKADAGAVDTARDADAPLEAAAPDTAGPADGADAAGDADAGDVAGDARDCMPAVHPGTITFVNETKGTKETVAADSVPESLRFVMTAAGKVPVVKVVSRGTGAVVEILLYGPCDQLLEVTRTALPLPGG